MIYKSTPTKIAQLWELIFFQNLLFSIPNLKRVLYDSRVLGGVFKGASTEQQ